MLYYWLFLSFSLLDCHWLLTPFILRLLLFSYFISERFSPYFAICFFTPPLCHYCFIFIFITIFFFRHYFSLFSLIIIIIILIIDAIDFAIFRHILLLPLPFIFSLLRHFAWLRHYFAIAAIFTFLRLLLLFAISLHWLYFHAIALLLIIYFAVIIIDAFHYFHFISWYAFIITPISAFHYLRRCHFDIFAISLRHFRLRHFHFRIIDCFAFTFDNFAMPPFAHGFRLAYFTPFSFAHATCHYLRRCFWYFITAFADIVYFHDFAIIIIIISISYCRFSIIFIFIFITLSSPMISYFISSLIDIIAIFIIFTHIDIFIIFIISYFSFFFDFSPDYYFTPDIFIAAISSRHAIISAVYADSATIFADYFHYDDMPQLFSRHCRSLFSLFSPFFSPRRHDIFAYFRLLLIICLFHVFDIFHFIVAAIFTRRRHW